MTRQLSRDAEMQVLEGVDRIAASGALGGGERLPAMLRWLVREELAGRGARIKSFTLATEVLGRGGGFDPQSDSIARAEMGRLRRALELYYATKGASDPVRLTIPSGSYRPVITLAPTLDIATPAELARPAVAARRRPTVLAFVAAVAALAVAAGLAYFGAGPAGDATTGMGRAPTLIVQSVTSDRGGDADVAIAQGLKGEIAASLSQASWLTVILPPEDAPQEAPASGYALDVRFAHDEQRYVVRAFLKRAGDNAVRWSQTYQGAYLHRETKALIAEVAQTIARDLGRTGGVIEAQEMIGAEAALAAEQAFTCRLSARRYWHVYGRELRDAAESCMRALLSADPAAADARATLALFQIEAARTLSGQARTDRLRDAESLLAPLGEDATLVLTARLALAACQQDRAGVIRTAETLTARFPNDPAILADAGSKLGLAAEQWEKAQALETQAMALNPFPAPWYPLSTAVKALIDGKPDVALAAMARAPQRQFVTGHAVLLATGAALADSRLIDAAKANLDKAGLADPEALSARIAGECWTEGARQAVRGGVKALQR